jgi:predicted nucleic acid-binding protein
LASRHLSLPHLITVGQATLIQNLFGHVLIPRAVELELTHPSAPAAVREWMAHPHTTSKNANLLAFFY